MVDPPEHFIGCTLPRSIIRVATAFGTLRLVFRRLIGGQCRLPERIDLPLQIQLL